MGADGGKKAIVLSNYGGGHRAKDVYSIEGIAPTITTGNHGLGTAIAARRKRWKKRK